MSSDGTVTIEGYDINERILTRLLTNDQDFAKAYRKLIRKALQAARRRVSNDIKFRIGVNKDPRAAYKAVKMAAYKSIFGGNISILNRRKASKYESTYQAPRTLVVGQRGGNRVPMSARTIHVNSYYGVDRGFILRWLEEGIQEDRTAGTRGGKLHGNRGPLPAQHEFSEEAPKEMEKAIEEIAEALSTYIESVTDDTI